MNNLPPTAKITVAQARKYMRDRYDHVVTRQTIYNYMNKGLRNESLQYTLVKAPATVRYSSSRVTTRQWIDNFFARCGIKFVGVGLPILTPEAERFVDERETDTVGPGRGGTSSAPSPREEFDEGDDGIPEGR